MPSNFDAQTVPGASGSVGKFFGHALYIAIPAANR